MNNHLHITLVGGQPVPVYQGILHSNSDNNFITPCYT